MGRFESGQIVSLILLMPGLLGLYVMLPNYSLSDVLCYAILTAVVLLNFELELPSEVPMIFLPFWLLLLGYLVGWKQRSHITSGMKYFYLSCCHLTLLYHWLSFQHWIQVFKIFYPSEDRTHDQVFKSSLSSWAQNFKFHVVFKVCGHKVFAYHYTPQDLQHCHWRRRKKHESSVKRQATNYEKFLLPKLRNADHLFQVPKSIPVPVKPPEEAIIVPEEAIIAPEEGKHDRTPSGRSKRESKEVDYKLYSRTTVQMMLIFEILLKFMLLAFRKKRKVFQVMLD